MNVNLEIIEDHTSNENTRNNRYLILKNGEGHNLLVSHGRNLINCVNDLLSSNYTDSDLRDDNRFRDIVTELGKKDYSVFQLTRL